MPSATYDPIAIARVITEQQRAMLRTVSLDLIVQECARRGHQVCLHSICLLRRDALPAGYPPLANEDVTDDSLPFDASKDGRA